MSRSLAGPMFDHHETLNEARERNIRDALAEDLGRGDPAAALLPPDHRVRARLTSGADAVLCGRDWFEGCVLSLDRGARIHWHAAEGDELRAAAPVGEVEGDARAVQAARRAALNLLQVLSATATATRRMVRAVAGASPNPRGCAVVDTRATLPGLRQAQKYAVRVGGGRNGRLALWDGIRIQAPHIAAAGGVGAAWQLACARRAGVDIQIELRSLEQLEDALRAGATSVRLAGFGPDGLREAVRLTSGRALLEAPAEGDLQAARAIAASGVDRIALDALTQDLTPVGYALTAAV